MMTTDPVDRERVFIISFFLSDDSMSALERPQRNSGRAVWTVAAAEMRFGLEMQIYASPGKH